MQHDARNRGDLSGQCVPTASAVQSALPRAADAGRSAAVWNTLPVSAQQIIAAVEALHRLERRQCMYPLDESFRAELRFFAFLLGNGTLIPKDADFAAIDYADCTLQDDQVIGTVFAVYLNNLHHRREDVDSSVAIERAAQWLAHHCEPSYRLVQPFAAWELQPATEAQTLVDVIKTYTRALGDGSCAQDILADINYRPHLVEYGSFLEQIIAIFTNVLRVDDEQIVQNGSQAEQRAAQYIRQELDPAYQVIPPFADWEVILL
jgi:hypothetical protein